MDVSQLKHDAISGVIDIGLLIDRFVFDQSRKQSRIEELESANFQLLQENAELHKRLGDSPTAKIDQPYSMKAEEKREEQRTGKKKRKESKKQRRGRIATEIKLKQAQRIEDIYPANVDKTLCVLSHARVVWRVESGQAVLVGYRMFRGPKKTYGVIPGVLGRSEFGLEITVTLAYLVKIMGLSFDKACLLLGFLQNVKLRKSQADALLNQLTRYWADEFEVLCTLLANSLVVHTDETSWSINSVWVFLSEKARILLFGVHKDGATLEALLDPKTFAGLVFSDDAAVYDNFTKGQKCWAHLLRKAIKLTLQDPQNEVYRTFLDQLLAIYRKARRIQVDKRFTEEGKKRKAEELTDELFGMCNCCWEEEPVTGLEHDRRLLAREIVRLAGKDQLFNFMWAPEAVQPNGETKPVDGTNNESERTHRPAAQARDTGRTSKTLAGARRTSILTSVLESLRLFLKEFTLQNIVAEIIRWQEDGRSCFRELMERLGLTMPAESILDKVMPTCTVPEG